MRADIQLIRQNLTITGCLIQHINEVAVLKNVRHFAGRKQVFHILGDAGGNAAPFTESLPDFHAVGRCLLFFQKQMELVHIVAGGFTGITVGGYTPPDLILHHQHPDLFHLLAQLLDVIADDTVVDVHIGAVVKEVQRAGDIDLQRRRHMAGLLFLLLQQRLIEVLQEGHILRDRVFKILLVDLVDAAVNDRFLHRLKPLLAAHHQLTEGEDEVRFQGDGVILLGVVQVDVHGVDILRTGRADLDDLPIEPLDEGGVLRLRVADDHIIIRHQKGVGDLPLGGKGLARTGRTQNQPVGVFQGFPVHHDQVVGQGVQAVIEGFLPVLEQLLRGERDKNGGGAGGQPPLDLNEVLRQRQGGHQPLLLLEVQAAQDAVVLLGDALGLEHVGLQLLLGAPGVHHKERDQEHPLVLALQLFQEGFGVPAVGGEVGGDDVDVVSGAHRLFLLLNFGAVKLGDRALHRLDGLVLVEGLDVHGDDLAGVNVQHIRQHPVADIRRRDGQKGQRPVHTAHLEGAPPGKGEGGGGDEVLHRKPRFHQPLPLKLEGRLIAHVEHGVHQAQALLAIQHCGGDADPLEVVEQIRLHMVQPGLGLLHGRRLDAEGQVLGFGQTVVAAGELAFEHLAVLHAHTVKLIPCQRDADGTLKALRVGRHVHKGQLKADGAVEEVEKAAPLLKDGGLVLLLGKLVVDVIKLDGLGVVVVGYPADTVREHPLERDRLLGGAGRPVIPARRRHDFPDLLLLLFCQTCRENGGRRFPAAFFPRCKQWRVPPFPPGPAASGQSNSCSLRRDGSSGEGISPG